jgi:hypothetical protein
VSFFPQSPTPQCTTIVRTNSGRFGLVVEHDLDEEAGFRAAVTEGCAALGWTRTEWEFKFPHEPADQGIMLILCKPKGSTPALEAFQ